MGGALLLTTALADTVSAQTCSGKIHVLAQSRNWLILVKKHKGKFKKLYGATFNINFLKENDRRAKSKGEASTIG